MANIQQATKSEAVARYQRLKSALARSRETARETMVQSTGVAVTAGGGFLAGVLDDRMPDIGGLPTNVVVGLGLSVAGLMNAAGDQSHLLVNLGGGVLAGAAYNKGVEVSREVTERVA